MSTPYGAPVSALLDSGLPKGDLLGRFESYLDAQKLVDFLADNNFPVANVSIVGNDLKMVERVTAKLSYPKVALSGAAQGALFGAFVGIILSMFGTGDIFQVITSVVLGMAIWMIFGVITYSMRGGKRDFASSQQVLATSYDVVVGFEHAQAARALAAKLPMRGNFAAQGGGFAGQQPVNPPQFGTQPTASAPTQPAAAGTSEQQTSPAPRTAEEPTQTPDQTARTSYSDLPDGRPQYGIRVDPAQQTPSRVQEPAASPESSDPSSKDEPEKQ